MVFKSQVTKVTVSWAVIVAFGVASFVAAKISVENNRKEVMKTKMRIRQARDQDSNDKFGTTSEKS